jgi:putrescine transport system ATP-binding protein
MDMGYVGHMSSYLVQLASGRVVRVTQANEGRRDNPIMWDEHVHVSFDPADFRVLTE